MRIKRTLIVSSLILALVLVVTIVSVSAAWFGDTLNQSNTIDVQTELPQGQIVIDTSSAKNYTNDKLVPAIMNKGWMLTATTNNTQNLNVKDPSLVGDGKPFESIAQTVYIYFPIYGVGQTSGIDGKLPAIVEIEGAYIPKDSAASVTSSSYNYIDELILGMEVVKDVQDEETTTAQGTKTHVITYTEVPSTPVADLRANDGKVHWGYSSTLHQIGLLIDQGVNCYIKLSVTFKKVDEEIPPELLDTLIKLSVNVPQSPSREDVLGIIATD